MHSRSLGKVLCKVLSAIAAPAFIGYGFKNRAEITNIQKHGMAATVEPVADYTEFKQGSSSTHTAEFHLKTADGREIVQKHSFPEDVLSDFNAGKPVQIFYLPQ